MIKLLRTLGMSLVLAASMLAFGSTSAQAATGGSFSYTFVGKCCINTRQFTTVTENDVWFDIDSMSPCDNWPGTTYGYPKVEVALYQSDALGDTHIGSDKTITDCSGDVKWADVNARKDLYFKIKILYPHRDSKTYTINGTVAYDGRTT